MDPYALLRPLAFALDPETAHELAITGMRTFGRAGLLPVCRPLAAKPCSLMGLSFPNRIGLAAGLDKNGEAIDALALMGFGSIEIGTVTPRPPPGHPKPRLCRAREAQGSINRM